MFKAFRFSKKSKPTEKIVQSTWHLPVADAPQEHQFAMQGLDVVISHSLKTVWVLDTSGSKDDTILLQLEAHLKSLGYFLFHTATTPDRTLPSNSA